MQLRNLGLALILSSGLVSLAQASSVARPLPPLELRDVHTTLQVHGHAVVKAERLVLEEGLTYGWRACVNRGAGVSLPLEVRMDLPAVPRDWQDGSALISPTTRLSEDLLSATKTDHYTTDEDGCVGDLWTATPGDPVGEYRFTVQVADLPAQSAVLNVVDPQSADAPVVREQQDQLAQEHEAEHGCGCGGH